MVPHHTTRVVTGHTEGVLQRLPRVRAQKHIIDIWVNVKPVRVEVCGVGAVHRVHNMMPSPPCRAEEVHNSESKVVTCSNVDAWPRIRASTIITIRACVEGNFVVVVPMSFNCESQ